MDSADRDDPPEEDRELAENFTFFCEMSMQEFAFGVGALGVNGLCLGMMLNIPTLQLHKLMYKIAPKGILQKDTTDQERVGVTKAIIDHWYEKTSSWKPKLRFKCLYDAFKTLREKEIAEELKKRFEADQPMSLEMFHKFDLGRLGPYVPPVLEVEGEDVEEEYEGYEEEEEEDDAE